MNITLLTGHLVKEKHPLLYELAVDLANYGANVTVVSGFPSRRIKEETRMHYLDRANEQISPRLRILRVRGILPLMSLASSINLLLYGPFRPGDYYILWLIFLRRGGFYSIILTMISIQD